MKEDRCCTEMQNAERADFSSLTRGFTSLSYEKADAILQNVLRACGYEEAHIKKCYAGL